VIELDVKNPPSRGSEQDSPADPAETPDGTPRKCGILVVDDDAAVRGVLSAGMCQQGFAVWVAAGGHEALDVYRRHHETIDVGLMDVHITGLDGPQTLAGLQEQNPQVRCCFISGDLGSYTAERLEDLGAVAVLRKPFQLAEVAGVLWEQAIKALPAPSSP